MMTVSNRTPIIVAVLALLALITQHAQAQTNRATFPENLKDYVLYATYDRGSSKEEAFALPNTLAIAKAGQPLPAGTRLVLGVWSNNALTDYFVMQKGDGWGLDFSAEQRTADWHFQQFDPNGQVRRTAIAERCQSCHQGAAGKDYRFTFDRLQEYLP